MTQIIQMTENEYINIPTTLQQIITAEQAWHYSIIPKTENNGLVEFFIDNRKDKESVAEELELIFGKTITLFPEDTGLINKSLGKYYRKANKQRQSGNLLVNGNYSDDFLIKLISEANSIGSSDIHIESYEEKCRIRMRLDGKLVERYVLNRDDYPALINKIKIKSNLDIAEKRLPQDGRIFFHSGADKFDIRVSVLPTLYGEKVVMRLLSKDATNIEITELGFTNRQLLDYREAIRKPHGIILISGPTGSGKTTTLYATLKILNQETSNILTIEDPIEYTLEGINQVQLKESIGLTFASALRTFLRQDPDIIMLGEIRDNETAQMAVRAALTGHLVLSTIHTNSAWGTISRLIDMEVPPYLAAGTLILSAAQRLVRLLCPACKEKTEVNTKLFPRSFSPYRQLTHHYLPKGCTECYFTGYKGRRAIFEVIPIDEDFSEKIKNVQLDAARVLKNKDIKLLPETAFEMFERGETSMEEIYSILLNA